MGWFRRLLSWVALLLVLPAGFRVGAAESANPELGTAELIAQLDPKYPGMSPIRHLASGAHPDPVAAGKEFVAYLRRRKGVPFTDRLEFNAKRAEDALAGRIGGRTFPKGKIDWSLPDVDIALTAMWSDFAAGYEKGHQGYATAFAKQFRSWRAQMHLPADKAATGPFTTLDVGRRLGRSWVDAYQVFIAAPQFTDDDVLAMVASMVEQARYLERYHSDATNWLVNEMLGLYTVGALFPELSAATGWRKMALQLLDGAVAKELLADGAWSELAPGYGNWNSNNILRVLDRAKDAGFAAEVPATLRARLDQSYAWMIRIMAPDGRVPRLNDCTGWLDIEDAAGPLKREFPNNPVIAWAAAKRTGQAPPASAYLPESGFMVMRTGWERDANYLLFDVGPMGSSWHGHQDKLQVLLWSGARELLMDNGGGPYAEGPQRNWSRSADGHSTVLVDGGGQARLRNRGQEGDAVGIDLVAGDPATPPPQFVTTAAWDYGCAWYQDAFAPSGRGDGVVAGPHPASQRREVAFLKPDVVVVVDTLEAKDGRSHRYDARWQVALAARRYEEDSRAVVTTAGDGPNLAIVPLVPEGLTVHHDSGAFKPEVLGWTFDRGRWLPALTVRHLREGSGVQRFVTVFRILKAGEKSEGIRTEMKSDGTGIAVFPDGRSIAIRLPEATDPGMQVVLSGGKAGRSRFDIAPPRTKGK